MTSWPTSSRRCKQPSAAERRVYAGPPTAHRHHQPDAARKQYESLLLAALRSSGCAFDVTWIRLASASLCQQRPRAHIDRHYVLGGRRAAERAARRPDRVGRTRGAHPTLRGSHVLGWAELSELLIRARTAVRSTLGLCWGGLALANLLAKENEKVERNLSGVYPLDVHAPAHPLLGEGAASAKLILPRRVASRAWRQTSSSARCA